jgi:SAM-dependent methyltransferase
MRISSARYSETFCDPTVARAYDDFYKEGTADEALWSIEREFLAEFYLSNETHWPQCSYLDFACGTGRVIAFMEQKATTSRGIDVSREMLDLARTKVRRSEMVCVDITSDAPPEATYDLITAFRFFLNTEPELRLRVMRALGRRLKNEHSRLVFNNHGNPLSYKALAWPIHRVRQLLFGRGPAGNYFTHREVSELVTQAKLRIIERTGCGLISPKLFKMFPSAARNLERRFGRGTLAKILGVDQIYVVGKK